MSDTLLIEIGCEEIPARMIADAAVDLRDRVVRILDQSGLSHGEVRAWGGPRRLAVRVDAVPERQEDREELVLGPPEKSAFGPDGAPTAATLGFAQKQGVPAEQLAIHENERGRYVAFRRHRAGKEIAALLGEALPVAVAGMSFPKSMRWGSGEHRWVRPVHWVVALHGRDELPIALFGVPAGRRTAGHRFLGAERVEVADADDYLEALARAHVVADPAERRSRLARTLDRAAKDLGGTIVPDAALLDEVADLVEWPGVVAGTFAQAYLELPRELLITTLRHHQKCFSVQDERGELMAAFVAVSNMRDDPSGHVRRGNEWVIGGRLEDARFFWLEDRKTSLEARDGVLERVVYHAKLGSYRDKARRMAALAERLAERLGLGAETGAHCRRAALLSKNDLVTGTVGEFPELQGRIGGLLLAGEGQPVETAQAVYEHYQPAGSEDDVPGSVTGAVVSVADKLDAIAGLIGAGEIPSGSRDPFGLRRAASGAFRVILERGWPLSPGDLRQLVPGPEAFLQERWIGFLRERGASANEVRAVLCLEVPEKIWSLQIPDVASRLDAIRTVRERGDFTRLVDLTKRVDNILTKSAGEFEEAGRRASSSAPFTEQQSAAVALWELVERCSGDVGRLEEQREYGKVVEVLATFVEPVERFFAEVLVLDPRDPRATLHRGELLARLRGVLTRCFDIRELAGQAEGRTP